MSLSPNTGIGFGTVFIHTNAVSSSHPKAELTISRTLTESLAEVIVYDHVPEFGPLKTLPLGLNTVHVEAPFWAETRADKVLLPKLNGAHCTVPPES